MMFQGLSLDQAPPYKIPLSFYITASIYFVVFALYLALASSSLQSRFDNEAIVLTHFFTIGFVSMVMVGSLFQMLPVMLGLPYKNVQKNAIVVYSLLNVGLFTFAYGMLQREDLFLIAGGIALFGGFLHFSVISLKTVLQSVEKDFLVNTFAMAFLLLGFGSFFGFMALLGHIGLVDSVFFGVLHISYILFGWIFLLVSAVSYRIIPMFFVAKEFPSWIKEFLFMSVAVFLLGFSLLWSLDSFGYQIWLSILSGFVAVFLVYTIALLYNRKRSRSDISVTLWYFSFINILIALVGYNGLLYHVHNQEIFLFTIFLLGGIYALINAMIYKIVPFLTWFHLSSSMVFEAQMHEVIPKKEMLLQVRSYYIGYGLFLIGFFIPFCSTLGAVFLVINGILLGRNFYNAMQYYKEYMKKKVSMESFNA